VRSRLYRKLDVRGEWMDLKDMEMKIAEVVEVREVGLEM